LAGLLVLITVEMEKRVEEQTQRAELAEPWLKLGRLYELLAQVRGMAGELAKKMKEKK